MEWVVNFNEEVNEFNTEREARICFEGKKAIIDIENKGYVSIHLCGHPNESCTNNEVYQKGEV